MDSLGLTWFSWIHWDSPGFIWKHFDLLDGPTPGHSRPEWEALATEHNKNSRSLRNTTRTRTASNQRRDQRNSRPEWEDRTQQELKITQEHSLDQPYFDARRFSGTEFWTMGFSALWASFELTWH